MTTGRTSFSFPLVSAAADEAQATEDFSTTSLLADLPEETAREGDAEDDDSDFVFAVTDSDAFSSASADEIFFEGRILPVYPLFDRDLLPDPSAEEETEVTEANVAEQIPLRRVLLDDASPPLPSSSEVTEAAGEFCAWTPNHCRKSASTGSSRRWRLRDLMVGRSHSDGKEKFVFLDAPPPASSLPAKEKKASTGTSASKAEEGKGTKKAVRVAEMDMATAHRLFYAKGTGSDQAVKGPRRSFLPYRQELYGLFTPINTLQRSRPPF